MQAILSLLGLLAKVLLPVLIFLKGKRDARKEMAHETLVEELEDVKVARKIDNTVDNMSDDELVDSVYRKPTKK